MNYTKIFNSLLIAIASTNICLQANAGTLQAVGTLRNTDTLKDALLIGQIPVQVRDVTPTNVPGQATPPANINSQINITPSNNNQIQIFDPLRPSNSPTNTIPEPPASQISLTGRVIPATSAIVVTVPNDLQLDAGGTTSITLVLARAIFDENGEEVAPINSLVSARLQPNPGGVRIVADSLILRGKHVQIVASNAVYRGETITSTSGATKGDTFGNLGDLFLRPFGDISFVGRGVGTVIGLLSPEQQTTVRIPQGTIFVLSLQSNLTLK